MVRIIVFSHAHGGIRYAVTVSAIIRTSLIRGLIGGKYGYRKNIILLNLLLKPDLLDFNKMVAYGKNLFQPKYKM